MQLHSSDCRSIEINPTGDYIISAGFDGLVVIYDIKEDKIKTKLNNHFDK